MFGYIILIAIVTLTLIANIAGAIDLGQLFIIDVLALMLQQLIYLND